MLGKIKNIFKYLSYDIWHENLESLNNKRFKGVRALRILLIVCNGFSKDRCSLHASSLTFLSLLSFVPILTICFMFVSMMGITGVIHGEVKTIVRQVLQTPLPMEQEFVEIVEKPADSPSVKDIQGDGDSNINGDSELIDEGIVETGESVAGVASNQLFVDGAHEAVEIQENISSNSKQKSVISIETVDRLIDILFEKINSINYKALGFLGVLVFVWTVYGLLERIELAFNTVWKLEKQRTFKKKLRDYSVVLFVVPILCAIAFIIPLLNLLLNSISRFDGGIIQMLLNNVVTRFLIIASLLFLSFAMIHKTIPNTKVNFKPALIGGIFTALIFVLWFKLCITLQIGVSKYSAAFGGFAIIPIILFWVYISWQIILLGAEIAYAFQNWRNYCPKAAKKL